MSDSEKKLKLIDLRVVDLKSELEKRSLDVTGIKLNLLERLTQALKDEGEDPEEFVFGADKKSIKKTVIRGSRNSVQKEENTEEHEPNVDATEASIMVEEFEDVDQVGEIEKDDEEPATVVKEPELEPPAAPTIKEIKEVPVVAKLALNVTMDNDNEDSLNLTIGEEDEQLLRDEAENDSKDNNEFERSKDDKNEKSGDEKEDSKKSSDGESVSKTNGNSKAVAGKDDKESTSKPTTTPSVKTKITAPASSTSTLTTPISRNLWVSGLSSLTRATDLKQIFSKYGKVIGAKVVTNTRSPGTRCYGYVTMASAKDATECIDHLHHTELHGRMITVERAKSDLGAGPPATTAATSNIVKTTVSTATIEKKIIISDVKPPRKEEPTKKTPITAPENTEKKLADDKSSKPKESTSTIDKKKREEAAKKPTTKDSDRKSRERANTRVERKDPVASSTTTKRSDDRKREILSFNKIREQRDRQRIREKERELREEERRRREIRRRQRDEEQRLTREREKLALERAKIEKEKAELLKLEKEKLEYERMELARAKRKIEEAKRSMKRPVSTDRHYEDRKRPATESSRRFEAPPPPRFDPPIVSRSSSLYDRAVPSDSKKRVDEYIPPSVKRDDYPPKRDEYKRDTYKRSDDYNKREVEMPRHSNSSYERSSGPSITISKESRYSDRPAAIDFRSSRNVESDRERNGGSNKPRYLDPPADNRYNDRSGGVSTNSSAWHNPAPPQIKPFGNIPNNNVNEMWNTKPDNGWRSSMDNNQDRYDRTYNERKAANSQPSPFIIDTNRPNQFIGSGLGNVIQPRYGAVPSRYENGRF